MLRLALHLSLPSLGYRVLYSEIVVYQNLNKNVCFGVYFEYRLPIRHLLVLKWTMETPKKVWNLFKVNYKDTERHQWSYEQIGVDLIHFSVFLSLNLNTFISPDKLMFKVESNLLG